MSERAPAGAAPSPSAAPAPIETLLQEMCLFLARACASEDLDERLELPGASGPVKRVLEALNAFLDKLWMRSFELSAKQEMLEKVVEIRTNEVHEILDNVSTGFLLTLADETVLDNFSRSCVALFGTSELKGKRISDLMGFSETRKAHFALCYQQIFEGMLPPEVSAGQLPAEFNLHDRNYSVLATPILGRDGQVAKVFFSINDTTELRKLEAENALRKALVEIVRQRESFAEFLRETSRAFEAARSAPSQVKFRNLLHTAKGNLGCYGLYELAALIHSIEDAPEISSSHLQRVEDTLKQFLKTHRDVIGLEYPTSATGVRQTELERLRPVLTALVAEPDLQARQAALAELLHRASWIEARILLAPLRSLFSRVAERLDKPAELELIGQDILVDPQHMGVIFANLGHLIRNSLDHGLERAADRGDKPARGRVCVTCSDQQQGWLIEVSDDGRGIDAEAVCEAAVARGKLTREALSRLSHDERLRLIFLDGLTTKDEATIDSGRGVGMTALLDGVHTEGGRIDVWSQPGRGTRFSIHVPKPVRRTMPAPGRAADSQ